MIFPGFSGGSLCSDSFRDLALCTNQLKLLPFNACLTGSKPIPDFPGQYRNIIAVHQIQDCGSATVSGYAGSEDWKVFYVVYMTDAYFTQDQIMAEFSHTNTDKNWKPILVYGKGSRK